MMEVSQGSGVCAALCIRRTLRWHVTISTPMVIVAILTVFWLFLTNGTLNQSSKTPKTIGVPIVTGLPRLYKQCTNGVPIVKNSQKQSKDSQNSKNDHWCTNRHMSTKTVPTVYQQCTSVEMWLRGHSRSLKLVPFKSLGAVSYSPSIVTLAVSVAVCKIFRAKEWCDLENRVRFRSRSLEMAHLIDSIRVPIRLP